LRRILLAQQPSPIILPDDVVPDRKSVSEIFCCAMIHAALPREVNTIAHIAAQCNSTYRSVTPAPWPLNRHLGLDVGPLVKWRVHMS
ncbi:hypothetical protein, partial [Streptococcus pneumoniae]|uniref:hypothetical protein n=1 Tax=Streptococcus pneumoniae TaxID=1313 RepID=UPI0018B055B2